MQQLENKVIAVNLTGPWLGCQEAAKQMVSQGGSGRISRMGKSKEVADLSLYLASGASAYVTGSTFFIDGGLSRHTSSL